MAATHPSPLLEPALLERVKGLTLVARRIVEGALHGLHHSPLHGLSIEFAQHRAYTPGDELKHLDWRVLGRCDRYVVKQHQQETNLRAVVFVDCSRSMAYGGDGTALEVVRRLKATGAAGFRPRGASQADSLGGWHGLTKSGRGSAQWKSHGLASRDRATHRSPPDQPDTRSKFHYARRLAAALSYLMLHQGDSVGLILTNYRMIEQVPPRAALGHIVSICQVLENATPDGITDVSGVLGQFAARLKRRSLVVLISDLLDDPDSVLSALGQLHHRGHEVIVFQVLDPREIDFDLGLAGYGVTVIRDMETGEEFDAEPALIRELVRQEIQRFHERLDAGARRHGIHLLRCPTSEPVERVLTSYLHDRLRHKRVRRQDTITPFRANA
jgi:uncharacterized protein (DUF58 family)